MKNIKMGTGLTVFIIFFGIAVLEAFRTMNWPLIFFWILAGVMFYLADQKDQEKVN